jgi:hypothetical protein
VHGKAHIIIINEAWNCYLFTVSVIGAVGIPITCDYARYKLLPTSFVYAIIQVIYSVSSGYVFSCFIARSESYEAAEYGMGLSAALTPFARSLGYTNTKKQGNGAFAEAVHPHSARRSKLKHRGEKKDGADGRIGPDKGRSSVRKHQSQLLHHCLAT